MDDSNVFELEPVDGDDTVTGAENPVEHLASEQEEGRHINFLIDFRHSLEE